MTDLRSSVPAGEAGPEPRPASPARAAVTAALWAAAVGLVVITVAVLLAWSADPASGGSAGSALRSAADAWLLAQGARLRTPGSTFGLLPLGLSAVPGYLLRRAGGSMARSAGVSGPAEAGRATATLAVAYAILAVVVAGAATTSAVAAGPVSAALGAGLLALVCGGWGVLSGAGLLEPAWGRVPAPVRAAARGGAVAVCVVLAGSAIVAGAALAVSAGEAGRVFDALAPGAVGGVVLLLVSLAYLPTATVWSAAFVVGPGFGVGAGTTVSLLGVRLHPLPALPLLAALPGGPVAGATVAVLALPLAGGLIAGAVVARRQAGASALRVLLSAAGAGPAAGLLLGVLCGLTSGPAGGGRLAAVGPSAPRVALVLAVEVGVPALASAWWTTRRRPA